MEDGNWWEGLGGTVNNAFFFVVDKIIDLQDFFIGQALSIGRVVLLIAILSAALNYALTGTGLKENVIKILKATVFFFIVIFAYPKIIGFITSWTFDMAKQSVYPSVYSYFNEVVNEYQTYSIGANHMGGVTFTGLTGRIILRRDNTKLFNDLTVNRSTPQMNYTTVAPAAVFKVIFFIAGECFSFADGDTEKKGFFPKIIPETSRILKGFFCGIFIIVTGIFALLEYLVCFLEFMLVASVGVILFPMSIWEGSKFMSEKFIGAILGFFIKLLFCNIAVFLLLYGFISLFYILSEQNGFNGTVDQIIFIVFIGLMFFYICKSAPALAQSLLTGTPSLSGTGAISAVAGAVAAAGAVMEYGKKKGKEALNKVAGGTAKEVIGGVGNFKEANAARKAVRDAGGNWQEQGGAFINSLERSAGDRIKAGALGLTRSLTGVQGGINPHSWTDNLLNQKNDDGENMSIHQHYDKRREEGALRGMEYAAQNRIGKKPPAGSPPPPPSNQP